VQRFIVQRLLQSLLALLFLSVVVFFMTWATGDPVRYIKPPEEITEEEIEALRKELGLDKPLVVQYVVFVGRAVKGDFGYAITLGRLPVTRVIRSRLPATLHLGAMAMAVVLVVAFPLGVFAAYNRGRVADTLARSLAFAGQSVPEFWLALLLILIFGVQLKLLPIAGREGGWTQWILPSVTAGWFSMAGLLRITRSSVLEVLGSDYIRTARAKGLHERIVLWRHTVRNALITIITALALLMVGMLNGIVLVETVFGWPGLGRLAVSAVTARDLFLVQGIVLLIGVMYLCANLIADIMYALVDPRIKLGGNRT
jgi:peptide/nickel transport system permease protein